MIVRVSPILDGNVTYRHLIFWCPGCDDLHAINVEGEDGQQPRVCWHWNEDENAPTIQESVKVHHGDVICHSFIRAGRIQFLADCTHELRNRLVDLPELPAYLADGSMGDAPR